LNFWELNVCFEGEHSDKWAWISWLGQSGEFISSWVLGCLILVCLKLLSLTSTFTILHVNRGQIIATGNEVCTVQHSLTDDWWQTRTWEIWSELQISFVLVLFLLRFVPSFVCCLLVFLALLVPLAALVAGGALVSLQWIYKSIHLCQNLLKKSPLF
jgi:hypothetical protein